jgi:hypothetical protein
MPAPQGVRFVAAQAECVVVQAASLLVNPTVVTGKDACTTRRLHAVH